jgi:hypothetical protein
MNNFPRISLYKYTIREREIYLKKSKGKISVCPHGKIGKYISISDIIN